MAAQIVALWPIDPPPKERREGKGLVGWVRIEEEEKKWRRGEGPRPHTANATTRRLHTQLLLHFVFSPTLRTHTRSGKLQNNVAPK